MSAVELTPSLIANPSLARWIRFEPGQSVRIATGKVEIGQGIVTAIAQIAAEELDIPFSAIDMLSGDSAQGPDELYTTASLSIEVSGASVRMVCAEVRMRMLDRIAQRLNCARTALSIVDGAFLIDGEATGFDYWRIAPEVDLESPVSGSAPLKPVAAYSIVGQSVPRIDLPSKVTGAAFIHDLMRPHMVHARILRQPSPQARLNAFDEAALVKTIGEDLRVVRVGDFVAFVSVDEALAERAGALAPTLAQWTNVPNISATEQEADWLEGQPSKRQRLGAADADSHGMTVIEASYSRPYVAHASMGPSCALAEMRGGQLSVWSHGQGMHPLRRTLAGALGMDPESITAHHAHGPGCYGHNGADDVALDAAIIAREMPGHCVRVQWRREEEFGFEPLGTAMLVKLRVAVDAAYRPQDWTTEIWSGVHVQRPGSGGGHLLAVSALPNPPPPPELVDPPEARGGGATRNAVPLYDIPAHRIDHHLVPGVPVRTSALRGLGALPNVFAIESMLDELAEQCGQDPLTYRLAILSEARGRRVLERVAQLVNWPQRGPAGSGKGLGLGMAQYKNRAAYAAVAAAVEVDEQVTLTQLWCVADAGLVINPDGVRNQLEGGMVQAASWTLKEQVRIEGEGIVSLDWDSYPILRFSELPPIEVELIAADEHRSLGAGECTIGPTAAAIGNAVAHALGARIRALPLTRERISAALLK